jgi:hypothetical protein
MLNLFWTLRYLWIAEAVPEMHNTLHYLNAKMIMYLLTSDTVLVSSHNSHHVPRLDETFDVRKVD